MFSDNFSRQKSSNSLQRYMGVDLENHNCHNLEPNAFYSRYTKDELHYPIGAIQKGFKPHTFIGIKRLQKKKFIKRQEKRLKKVLQKHKTQSNKKDQADIPALIPKSPQTICMKALRTKFRNQLQENHIQVQKQGLKVRRPGDQRRKQNQRKRRIELIKLLKEFQFVLVKAFGQRAIYGYGRCPQLSRQEIKQYLRRNYPKELQEFERKKQEFEKKKQWAFVEKRGVQCGANPFEELAMDEENSGDEEKV